MSKLTLGVIGTSKKEDERRVPIHPEHLVRVPEDIRRQLIFEEGYGEPFGIADSEIAAHTGGIATRHDILADIGTESLPSQYWLIYKNFAKEGHFGAMCIAYSNRILPRLQSIVS